MFRRPFAMLATLAAVAVASLAAPIAAAVPSPGVGVVHDVMRASALHDKLTTTTFILSSRDRRDYSTPRRLTRDRSERRTLGGATVDMTSIDLGHSRASLSEVSAIRRWSVG